MGRSKRDLSKIDVIVLCGGLGTRLRSVVRNRPKPMADVGGRPFLALLLDHLVRSGFTRFILCCGYRSGTIKSFFRTFAGKYTVRYSMESKPLGTGGALRRAARLVKGNNAIVMNGDSFCAVDYNAMIQHHMRKRAFVTIAVCRVPKSDEFGKVVIDGRSRITEFVEKGSRSGSGWVNAGVYVFRKSIVAGLPKRTPLSLEHDVFPSIAAHNLFAYKSDGVLLDIGTPGRYKSARKHLADIMEEERG
jgi:NDP-sugar pyrophosphorylase family protein